MGSHPAHIIALGLGSGLSPVAPGTVGTLWAWAAYLLLQLWLTPGQIGVLIAVSTVVGWWACTVTARHLNTLDPGKGEAVASFGTAFLVFALAFAGLRLVAACAPYARDAIFTVVSQSTIADAATEEKQ